MSDTEPRRRILLGSYESGTHIVIVPPRVLAEANETFDVQRREREREAARAKLAVTQGASARSKLRKAMHAVFRRRGR
jgi:hypothetical protein